MNAIPKRPGISEATLVAADIKYCDFPEPGWIQIGIGQRKASGLSSIGGACRRKEPIDKNIIRILGLAFMYFTRPDLFVVTALVNLARMLTSFLTEGEFKTLSLLEAGVWAVGIPSFTVYQKDENGNRRLLRDLQVTLGKEKPSASIISAIMILQPTSSFRVMPNSSPRRSILPKSSFRGSRSVNLKASTIAGKRWAAGFDIFFADLIHTAIELPRKIKAPAIALMLLERETTALKALVGGEREKQSTDHQTLRRRPDLRQVRSNLAPLYSCPGNPQDQQDRIQRRNQRSPNQ